MQTFAKGSFVTWPRKGRHLADFFYFATNTDNAVNQAVNTCIPILTTWTLSMSLLTTFSFFNFPLQGIVANKNIDGNVANTVKVEILPLNVKVR